MRGRKGPASHPPKAVAFSPLYHRPRFGRPALALDMMEPYRPILADSTVIQVVSNGEVKPEGFVAAGPVVNLRPHARPVERIRRRKLSTAEGFWQAQRQRGGQSDCQASHRA